MEDMPQHFPPIKTPASWGALRALIDIACDRWNQTLADTRHGSPPALEAVLAVEKALDMAESSSFWSDAELAKARQLELRAFSKQDLIYLRRPPIHWSPAKAEALFHSQGPRAAALGAFASFSTFCTNLAQEIWPNKLSLKGYYIRHDVGGKLLNLSSLLGGGAADGKPSGRIALRERILLAHGAWCKAIRFSSAADYFFGSHRFGYGTWVDQLVSVGGSAASRWGADLLLAAETQMRAKLPPPAEAQWAVEAFSSSLPNQAARSAHGDELGHQEWLWNIQFPMGPIEPAQVELFRKHCAHLNGFDPLWKDKAPASWNSALEELAAACCGPDGREVRELGAAQGRWLALRESMDISELLAPSGEPSAPPRTRPRI